MDNYMHDTSEDEFSDPETNNNLRDSNKDIRGDESDNNSDKEPNSNTPHLPKSKKRKRKHFPNDELIRKLDLYYKRLTWYRSPQTLTKLSVSAASLLKRFLTKPIFEVLKLRLTKCHCSSLLDVIHVGIEHLDLTSGEIQGAACGGVLIPDVESYVTFRPILHPIICVLQDATPEKKQPKEDWDLLLSRHIPEPNIDPKCIFVESVAITISRSIKEYPFLHKMSEKQLKKMEKEIKSTFKLMTMTKKNKTQRDVSHDNDEMSISQGTYFSFENLPKGLERQLDREGILFDKNDPGLDTANAYQFWPNGRGIFLIGQTHKNVAENRTKKKDVSFVWINESDHIKVIVGRKDGNLYEAFVAAYDILNEINGYIGFERDGDQFGYLTISPSMVGTGLKASVRMRLPFLGEENLFRDEICHQHNLAFEDAITNKNDDIENFYEVSNKRTFGITETEILQDVYRGVREIISIETRYKEP